MTFLPKWLCISILILLISTSVAAQPSAKTGINEAEIKAVINESADCDDLRQVQIDHLEYFDFNGDGENEAVVVASTCMTGTAGPDIHSVYTRNAEGKVVEMPFHDPYGDPFFRHKGPQIPVFGNPNYGLSVENRQLVARWMDSSDRQSPLVIWYRWDGKEFVVQRVKAEGPFTTSYDCSKAEKEMDRAICYSPSIAVLDVKLAEAYRHQLRQQPPEKRPLVQQHQKDWLAMREKQCTIYKWWVDCLTDLYNKRIAELQQP